MWGFLFLVLFKYIYKFGCGSPITIGNKMKVNPRHIIRRLKTGVLHACLTMILMVTAACDFDIPQKFEMPTWYLDLKIPLVQTKFQMADISDSTNGIFPTDDSLGFKAVLEGAMDPTSLPDLPPVDSVMDQQVSSGEIAGISIDMDLPSIELSQRIDVVLYGTPIYQDTAKWCDTVTLGTPPFEFDTLICITDSTTGDTLGRLFQFPLEDTTVHMTAENYNSLIVAVFDSVMGALTDVLNTTTDLGLSSIELPSDPAIIASIDTLVIGSHPTNSTFQTKFGNNNIPTNLVNVFSNMVTGINDPLTDTLANHNQLPTISAGQTYLDTTDLSGKGLTGFLGMSTNFGLSQATDVVAIPPGSLYVDFSLKFGLSGIDSIDVTTNNYSLSDGIEMPSMELPEMDMSESGISKLEIYRSVLKETGAAYNENKLIISDLQSTLPFDLNFLVNFQNFSPDDGGDSVKIDTILRKGIEINKTFDMRGYGLQSPGYPDSAMSSFDLVLDMQIPEQKASIPLDGSPLGEFTMGMNLQKLSFQELEANLFMEMPSDSVNQDLPQGISGAVPTEAVIEIIFKNQIRLPIEMNMDFKGKNSLAEDVFMPVAIDTIGFPLTNNPLDTSMTIIGLSKLGTTITIYESVTDSTPSYSVTTAPCDTCSSIIDLLGENLEQLTISPEVKVDGRGSIEAGKAIQGGFRVTMPFVLRLEPMTFMGSATKIDEFDHDTRYKIRNSLRETALVSNITNALPFGAEVSILMSNDSVFPMDNTIEALSTFRDTLAGSGLLLPTDSLYIINECLNLSPDSGLIYIYNIMTDYSECIDGLPYIVKFNGSGTDTVMSYVDTLFKFLLPDPESYYGANDTSGFPEGMVALPGSGIYPSVIDTSQIFLLTDYGNHYTMPRFHLPGTDTVGVFLSVLDYLEISSFITFTLNSSGAFAPVNNEVILTSPNGGQTFQTDDTMEILWKSYGTGSESVDLYYSITSDSNTYKSQYCVLADNWVEIGTDLDNTGSYEWDLSGSGLSATDSLRLKIITSDGKSCDINGHYISIVDGSTLQTVSRATRNKNVRMGR